MIDPALAGTEGNFALVSYVPEPFADFLNRIRLQVEEKTSENPAPPRAHVTLLPPRPLAPGATVEQAWRHLRTELPKFPPLWVGSGEVEIFPNTHVVYLAIRTGFEQVSRMHQVLNAGPLEYEERYPFHPHITLAQTHKTRADAERIRDEAESMLRSYRGKTVFWAETYTFVRNTCSNYWDDLEVVSVAPALR